VTQVPASKQLDDSLRQLSTLLNVYNELVALRRLSVALRRRCVFLENVQSLLRSPNSMPPDVVARPAQTEALGPSSKTGESRPMTSDGQQQQNGHRPLRYQGSGGLDGNSGCVPPADAAAPARPRSMSAGSIDVVGLDVASAVKSGTASEIQQDRRRSRKLQEKWEQVKKAFSSKLDPPATPAAATGRTKTSTPEKVGVCDYFLFFLCQIAKKTVTVSFEMQGRLQERGVTGMTKIKKLIYSYNYFNETFIMK